jgi:AraC family transcriptional regulator of adaptative response / DNA-3-methyladenine glycosylase II
MTRMDGSRRKSAPITMELEYRPPYAWPAIRSFFAARAIPGVEVVERDGYRRTFSIDAISGTVEVRPSPAKPALEATIRFGDGNAAGNTIVEEIRHRVRRVFDVDADLEPVEAHLSESPLLAPLIAAQPGLRVPGAWDAFELAVRAILGQQITVAGARHLAGRLASDHGEPLGHEAANGLAVAFPTAQRLSTADLTGFGVPGARARAITGLAKAADEDPELFREGVGLEACVARLRELPGIGEWSAQYIALRALGERDAFPASDVGLLRAATGPDGRRPSPRELLAIAESWRPWRAYAAQHLWTSLT